MLKSHQTGSSANSKFLVDGKVIHSAGYDAFILGEDGLPGLDDIFNLFDDPLSSIGLTVVKAGSGGQSVFINNKDSIRHEISTGLKKCEFGYKIAPK